MSAIVELRRMNSGGSEAENLVRREHIRRIFDMIDKNKDGQVNRQELWNALKDADIELPDHVVQILFDRGDIDEDGTISFEEFCKLVDEPDMKPFFQKFFNIPPMSKIKNQAIKYWQEINWIPPPMINFLFILVQVIIHIIDKDTQKLRAKLEFQPYNEMEIWRYYTYSLIHNNWVHLVGNSVVQFMFGTALEPVHGPRVAYLYIIGVFAGSLLHSVTNHASALIGASAGASALILAWLSDVCLNFSEQACPMVSILPVILFIVWQCVMTPGMTSVPAHISGGITGFLFGFIVLKNIREYQYERTITKGAIVIGVIYIVLLILLNVFNIYT